jgi:hypothetical protein
MKPRLHNTLRRAKLPPILEIDEYGLPVAEFSISEGRRWSTDADEPGVQMGEWPTEFDD